MLLFLGGLILVAFKCAAWLFVTAFGGLAVNGLRGHAESNSRMSTSEGLGWLAFTLFAILVVAFFNY